MHISSESDEELIAQYASSGNLEIIGQLYLRYSHLVLGVCYKFLSDRVEAKDMTMSIFEKLIDKLRKHKPLNFKTWLYVITKNECLMTLRKKQVLKNDFESEIMENSLVEHPIFDIEQTDKSEGLKKCLDELNRSQKDCVTAFFLEEKTYKTVSSELGIDIRKVKSNIQNGKRNLKLCMEKSVKKKHLNE